MKTIFLTLTPAEEEALILAGAFLAKRNKIQAIKTLRLVADIGLKEAKDYVDAVYNKMYPVAPAQDTLADRYSVFRNTPLEYNLE